MEYRSLKAEDTKSLAKKIARSFTSGVIALSGDLGAGKTTFTQGFAEGLGIKDKIISPTFVLMRIHKIPKSKKTLFHIDLYRLENSDQFLNLGLKEIIDDQDNIVLIEWAEKAKDLLPKNTLWITFENINENSRKITVL